VQDTTFARSPSGAGVFDAGTSRFLCVFSGCPDVPIDYRVQTLVANLLDSFLAPMPPVAEPYPREFTTSTRHVLPVEEFTTRRTSPMLTPLPTPAAPATPWWRTDPTPEPPDPATPEPTRRPRLGLP